MAEPKWTPGPWRIEERLLVYAGTKWVASAKMYDSETTMEEAQANAHLIAAAPDLYRELENLVELAEAAMRAANRDGGEYDIEAELADARAALRKARGDSDGD